MAFHLAIKYVVVSAGCRMDEGSGYWDKISFSSLQPSFIVNVKNTSPGPHVNTLAVRSNHCFVQKLLLPVTFVGTS